MATYGMFNPQDHEPNDPKGIKKPTRKEPGRGMMDGIRKDIKAAKAAGEEYDPRGTGAAWTHNFLNKKPWHPLTFRNMAKVWEKEHDNYEAEKKKAEGKAEYEAEQAYLKTLSLLSPEEQEKYRQRQSVAFLYQKPPGYDAALERSERAQAAGQAVGPGGQALPAGEQGQGQQQQGGDGGGGQAGPGQGRGRGQAVGAGGHLKNVISGIQAVQQQQQQQLYELKSAHAAGRSPPRGGESLEADNQQFVVGEMDSDEEEEAVRVALMPPDERRREVRGVEKARRRGERQAAAAQLGHAKAFLRAAGLTLPSDDEGSSDSSSSSGSGSSSSEGSEGGGEQRRTRRHKRRRHGGSKVGKRQKRERSGKESGRQEERKRRRRHKEKRKKKRQGGE